MNNDNFFNFLIGTNKLDEFLGNNNIDAIMNITTDIINDKIADIKKIIYDYKTISIEYIETSKCSINGNAKIKFFDNTKFKITFNIIFTLIDNNKYKINYINIIKHN